MKSIQEKIAVSDPLQSLLWRERSYVVAEILERWFYRGKWWLDPGLSGESRNYYRVVCLLQAAAPRPVLRQMGPYSDSVRKKKDPPLRLAATHEALSKTGSYSTDSKIFEIYQRSRPHFPSDWVLSRVID